MISPMNVHTRDIRAVLMMVGYRVTSRKGAATKSRVLLPLEQTRSTSLSMAAKCHKRTWGSESLECHECGTLNRDSLSGARSLTRAKLFEYDQTHHYPRE